MNIVRMSTHAAASCLHNLLDAILAMLTDIDIEVAKAAEKLDSLLKTMIKDGGQQVLLLIKNRKKILIYLDV